MAFRNVALPLFGGGLVGVGYVAFSWLRAKRADHERPKSVVVPRPDAVKPLSTCLERVDEDLALDQRSDQLPANTNAMPRKGGLSALFLGRVTDSLSPFHGDRSEGSRFD